MDNVLNFERIAVLIDADNAQLSMLKSIIDEISTYGRVVVKKAYGDWKNSTLKNWEDKLKQLAIKPEQQFAYTTGKNATDIALVIGAMDLLSMEMYDAFAIVCSDADYTPLAIRLRETGAYIFGIGEEKTPQAFRNACDSFILTNLIEDNNDVPEIKSEKTEVESSKPISIKLSVKKDIKDIHGLLKKASKKYQDEDGWVNAATAGNYIKRIQPDFESNEYGFQKLSGLLNTFPDIYETKKEKKEKMTVFLYRLK